MLIRVNEYFALLWLISQDSFSGMHGSHTHSCQVRSQCMQLPTSWVRFLLHHVLFKLTLFYTARENSSLRLCSDKIWRAEKVSINSSVSNSLCRWANFLLLAFIANVASLDAGAGSWAAWLMAPKAVTCTCVCEHFCLPLRPTFSSKSAGNKVLSLKLALVEVGK